MTVQDIIIKYLKDNGYDGLISPEGLCGCNGEIPCEECFIECQPAYLHLCIHCNVEDCILSSDYNNITYCMKTTKQERRIKCGERIKL